MNVNNLMAQQAHGQMRMNSLQLQSSLAKLSSGYRINSAADDAAGLAISEKLRAQMTGLERAMMNAQDGVSLVQTAEGALGEVHGVLNRLTELAGQASNGILNASQRQSIQREADDIMKEIDRVSKATNFNGINLLDGSLSGKGAGQVSVSGVPVSETAATAGQYEYSALPNLTGLAAGDAVSFSMAFNNGTSQNFSFTMDSSLTSMTAGDGTTYSLTGAPGEISGADFASALAGQLRGTAVAQDFNISGAGGSLSLTNLAGGTDATQIGGFSYKVGGGSYQSIAGSVTPPADARADIAKGDFQVFDGTNEAAATFSVNGQKFALVEENGFADAIAQYQGKDTTFIKVSAGSGAALDIDDLSTIAATVNQKTGLAFQADANGVQVKAQDGGAGLKLQVGDTAAPYNVISVGVGDMSAAGLGLKGLDFTTQEGAARALDRISAARNKVSGTRGDLGATQNRLGYTINNLGVTHENITASESRIRDVDMAKELMNLTRRQLLGQASQAMLGQANAQSAQLLQLLR